MAVVVAAVALEPVCANGGSTGNDGGGDTGIGAVW